MQISITMRSFPMFFLSMRMVLLILENIFTPKITVQKLIYFIKMHIDLFPVLITPHRWHFLVYFQVSAYI